MFDLQIMALMLKDDEKLTQLKINRLPVPLFDSLSSSLLTEKHTQEFHSDNINIIDHQQKLQDQNR